MEESSRATEPTETEKLTNRKQELEIKKLEKEISSLSPLFNWLSKAASLAPVIVAFSAIFYAYKSNIFESKSAELAFRKENLLYDINQFEQRKSLLHDSIRAYQRDFDTLSLMFDTYSAKVDSLKRLTATSELLAHENERALDSLVRIMAKKGIIVSNLE